MNKLTGDQVISGTFGKLWLDGDYVQEAYGLEAKIEFNKEDVPLAGKMADDTKFMGYKGTGSIKMHKVSSRMIRLMSESIKAGVLPRFQLISQLADPSAMGAERIEIKDVCFDDLTLAGWELKNKGEVEAPFTFTDWEPLDLI